MKTEHRWGIAIIPLLLSFTGCGGGSGNPTGITPTDCSITGQNQFVYDVMQDLYLYYDQLPVLNPSDYSSPEALLVDLRVAPDRFSFLADQQTQQNFFEEGTYNGIGFSFKNNEDSYTVTQIFDDSAAGRAGLKRSDQILSVEGISITQINDDGGLNAFLSRYNDSDNLTFSVVASGAQALNIEMSKGLVRMNTVISSEVITSNFLKIGYLSLSSFTQPTKAELATAFNKFKQENIDELVLDFRYNGGGRIDTAQILASYIAGDTALGADTAKLIYNNNYTDLNTSYPFKSLNDAVELSRLYVLTLEGTCSASELVINAMSPVGIDVVTIGQTTCGKPIGLRDINFCDKTLSPASFSIVNDIDQGEYFDGIAATCAADDDTSKLLADTNEGMFAEALYHMNNGNCSVAEKPSSKLITKNRDKKYKGVNNIMESVY